MSALLRNLRNWLSPVLNPLACLPDPEPEESAESAEALLKRLEAILQKQFRYSLSGEKRSILKGQGLDFADLREYTPGDDIRKIDWNVFARTLTPHIKEFHEEKQLTIWLFIDFSPSMFFGRTRTKARQALDLTGLLGLMAHHANHKLGVYVMSAESFEIMAPKSGYGHLQFMMQRLLELHAAGSRQTLSSPLSLEEHGRRLAHMVQKNSSIFLLSDFLSATPQWEIPLGQLSRHGRLVHLFLQDPSEHALPENMGLLPVFDPESRMVVTLDTGDRTFQTAYRQAAESRRQEIETLLKRTGTAVIASTAETPVEILMSILRRQTA